MFDQEGKKILENISDVERIIEEKVPEGLKNLRPHASKIHQWRDSCGIWHPCYCQTRSGVDRCVLRGRFNDYIRKNGEEALKIQINSLSII